MHSSQVQSVNSWLSEAGLQHHAMNFAGIEPEVFRSLLMQDYAKYGVTSLEDKQKLFRLVKSLQMPGPEVQQLPTTLAEASELLDGSEFARTAFGDAGIGRGTGHLGVDQPHTAGRVAAIMHF